jgi:AcrR family transcriptional regulator
MAPKATTLPERPGGKAATTRSAILVRAVDLASSDGLEGLTIGRLATEMEMSKSGLFAHFGSKEELQLATVGAAAKRFADEVVLPAQEQPEGAQRLRAYCDGYLDHLTRCAFPGGCFWAAAAAEFDDRPGPVRDAISEGVAGWTGELARQARAAGVKDPDQLAFEIYSIGLGANAANRLLGDGHAFKRARATIERLLPD